MQRSEELEAAVRRTAIPSNLALVVGVLGGALLLAGCVSTISRPPPSLQQKIEQAQTPEDHREVALYYDGQSKALLAKAEQHDRRARAYGPPTAYARLENDLARHCTYIASLYREAAEADLRLAKHHREDSRR